MKIKFSLILLLFFLTGLASLQARPGDFGNILSLTAAGFDPVGRYNEKVSTPGVSFCQEFYGDVGRIIQAGFGFKYLFTRELNDGESLSWQPFYGSLRVYIPSTELPVYAKGGAGYTFVQGNSRFNEMNTDLEGGLFYFLGGGIDLPVYYTSSVRFSFIFDMGYSSYNGSAKQGSSDLSITYLTLDMTAGIGLKF